MKNFYTDSTFLSFELQNEYKEFSFSSMDKKDNNFSFEMTSFENAFLFGLLKKYKPTKILEVGLAAGATTRMLVDHVLFIKFSLDFFVFFVLFTLSNISFCKK
jgi:hypothetical protein